MKQDTQKSSAEPTNRDNIGASERPVRKEELDIIERKARAMIALGEEIVNRVKELKAA